MVNIVFHSVATATDTDDSGDELEAQEDLLNDPVYDEVNPEVSQSSSGGWNSTETSLGKKLIKSFRAVSNIKRRGKHNSEKVDKFLIDIAKEKPKRFSSKQMKKFTQNFSDFLGSGGFGRVYRGKITNNKMQVAVKVLADNLDMDEQFMAEVSVLGRTYHRNLIKLLGFCIGKKRKALVYEYMENGSLHHFLFNNRHRTDWEKLYGIMLGVAKGLSYLHECCDMVIIHYDIKAANILLDSNFCPKICDFGLSQLYDRDKMYATPISIRGTVGYLAPELFMSSTATYKCDVFSFGILLFEIVGKRRNFYHHDETRGWFPQQVLDYFKKGKLEEFIIELGIDVKDREQAKKVCMVALWCIQYKPEDRPSMSSVVKILEGEIEITEPPCPFQFMAFPNKDSQVSITMHSGSIIVQEMNERDNEDFSAN